MPFKSDKQRRYIYAKASQGERWANDFIRHSGHTPPKKRAIKRMMRRK